MAEPATAVREEELWQYRQHEQTARVLGDQMVIARALIAPLPTRAVFRKMARMNHTIRLALIGLLLTVAFLPSLPTARCWGQTPQAAAGVKGQKRGHH